MVKKRTHPIQILVDEEERALILAASKITSLPQAALLRSACIQRAREVIIKNQPMEVSQ